MTSSQPCSEPLRGPCVGPRSCTNSVLTIYGQILPPYRCANHRGPISGAADDTGPSDLRGRAEAFVDDFSTYASAYRLADGPFDDETWKDSLATLLHTYGDERERQARLDEQRKVAVPVKKILATWNYLNARQTLDARHDLTDLADDLAGEA